MVDSWLRELRAEYFALFSDSLGPPCWLNSGRYGGRLAGNGIFLQFGELRNISLIFVNRFILPKRRFLGEGSTLGESSLGSSLRGASLGDS